MVTRSRTVSTHSILKGQKWILLLAGILLVPACGQSEAEMANGDDPMKALESPYPSVRYNATYWTQTSALDKELWDRAVAFCEGIEDPRDYPNCNAVRSVAALDRMAQPREDQPDTFSLVPEPWAQDTVPARR